MAEITAEQKRIAAWIIEVCDRNLNDTTKKDCSGFIKRVYREIFKTELQGNANAIGDAVMAGTAPWVLIGKALHAEAKAKADQGHFVIGATKDTPNGHVVIIVSGELVRGMPVGFAGSNSTRGDFSIRNDSIRKTWSAKWHDKIVYSYMVVPPAAVPAAK